MTAPDVRQPLGAIVQPEGRTLFRVWAPRCEQIEVHLIARDERIPLSAAPDGYHQAIVDCGEGARYMFVLNGQRERPDPASRLQPDGVHTPSAVVSTEFAWSDQSWKGVDLLDYVVYELHVGTFTPEGTFDAIIPRLDALRDLGITVIELLPIGQFPGSRNWGYDGVYVSAVQSSYGGPDGLKRLVDACHARGMAVALDVVYNHLGPEGNYLSEYAPYFTDRYKTPWGLAVNFDGPQSDYVRWFFIHSALMFVDEFHIDAFRVDAVHAIVDHTAEPFLQDLTTAVRARGEELGRRVYTIAESDLNDPRVITPAADLGLGFDAQWCDDFHHSLHAQLTGEQDGYYLGFGRLSDFARVFNDGYFWIGQHNAYRGRKYGLKPRTRDGRQFVISAQNHDQVGNRMMGERLSTLLPPAKVRLVAAATVLTPFIPMLFMGEEYAETAPFQYFTSHGDEDLIEAVRKGRLEEFDDFEWEGEPPDPHAEETFQRSKLHWERASQGGHAEVRALYRDLFRLRRQTPALRTLNLDSVEASADDERGLLRLMRRHEEGDVLILFNFSDSDCREALPQDGSVRSLLDSGARLEGSAVTLSPHSFAVLSIGS